eukprot:2624012-Pyramimonas_sp.AAC.1
MDMVNGTSGWLSCSTVVPTSVVGSGTVGISQMGGQSIPYLPPYAKFAISNLDAAGAYVGKVYLTQSVTTPGLAARLREHISAIVSPDTPEGRRPRSHLLRKSLGTLCMLPVAIFFRRKRRRLQGGPLWSNSPTLSATIVIVVVNAVESDKDHYWYHGGKRFVVVRHRGFEDPSRRSQ